MERRGVDFVAVTPPCDQFSALQNCSQGKSDSVKRAAKYADALVLLRFACKVCAWAKVTGRLCVFEHPSGAKSWGQSDLRRLVEDPSFHTVVGHQCAHNLRLTKELYMRKSTRFLTSGSRVAHVLSAKCPQTPEHVAIVGQFEGKSISRRAQVWTHLMCKRILRAIIEDYQRFDELEDIQELDNKLLRCSLELFVTAFAG